VHGVEVDFILYGSAGLYAIEVKNASVIHPKDLTGLKNFSEDYPEAILILLYRGKERLQKHNIICIPVEQFLLELHPGAGLPT